MHRCAAQQELLAAAERGLEGASQKDVSATLWALGYMRLNPSEQYWDAVGNRWVQGIGGRADSVTGMQRVQPTL